MTLRRRMGYQIGGMIVGLLLVSAAAVWGLNAMHQDFDAAIEGYQRLRYVYEVSSHVATARTLLSLPRPEVERALGEIQTAMGKFELFVPVDVPGYGDVKTGLAEAMRGDGENARRIAQLEKVLHRSAGMAAQIRMDVERMQDAADRKRRMAVTLMSILAAAVVVVAVIVGVVHYRGVMNPLRQLGEAVRRIAGGKFDERIPRQGPEEFGRLAEDFNRTAAELDELYRELERKVAEKSRELVRSERLASVGYLAAGVAHEINNPIGIIAGHAEFAIQQMKAGGEGAEETEKTLGVICEEAFRCKQIVEKLLTLARPGEEKRAEISLAEVAASVIATVGGLGQFRGRKLTLNARADEDVTVLASEGEMKQVVLNLAINGLEAVGEGGEVWIDVGRKDGMVELVVRDNGKGMSADVVERVFEPFFTAKRGAVQAGTGLGLSITHAIVESHGGRIRAYSEGVGKGSRFVVQLPARHGGGGL